MNNPSHSGTTTAKRSKVALGEQFVEEPLPGSYTDNGYIPGDMFVRIAQGWLAELHRFKWPMGIIVVHFGGPGGQLDDDEKARVFANLASIVREVDCISLDGNKLFVLVRAAGVNVDLIGDRINQMFRYGMSGCPAPSRITAATARASDTVRTLSTRACNSRRNLSRSPSDPELLKALPAAITARLNKLAVELASGCSGQRIAQRTRRSPRRFEWGAAESIAEEQAAASGLSGTIFPAVARLSAVVEPFERGMAFTDRSNLGAATQRLAKAIFLDLSDPRQREAYEVLVTAYSTTMPWLLNGDPWDEAETAKANSDVPRRDA
jgi:hypothetical protein